MTQKNEQLLELLDPNSDQDYLIVHGNTLEDIIFAINAKDPGEKERETARLLRYQIRSSPPQEVDVPIGWYVLEVFLDRLATQIGRKVFSLQECLEVARVLKFDDCESELVAALGFLHDNHLLHYFPSTLPDVVFVNPQVLLFLFYLFFIIIFFLLIQV